MNAESIPLDPEVFAEGLTDRVLRQFKVAAQDWLDVCHKLGGWEDRWLVDDPNPEALGQHAKVLRNLEWIGRVMITVTEDSKFQDRQFAEVIATTLQDLRDRRALWHGSMTAEQREQVLREIFPHES